MKKVIYGVLLIAVFGLTACGNDKKETTASSKVEQLESRVKELESSSSSEAPTKEDEDAVLADIKSDTNKKIAQAFFDAGLEMYVNKDIGLGVTEIDTINDAAYLDPIPETGLSFYTEKVDSGFEYIIKIYTYPDEAQMNMAIDNFENGEYSVPQRVARNSHINSFITADMSMSEADFNKYKDVFEKIQ
ncbi:hypothetical protein [Enterococcus sp. 5H]|uniref:hypothetical protein n=1 Tax=Enterococcus sp. 5H TaxID=1229490 RepID=UPI0023025A2C|nr:hypothetical protein [Enterococcus sp. 5H]MDA9472630.1 hypothetical protein [Enterococcus sp. 5H]